MKSSRSSGKKVLVNVSYKENKVEQEDKIKQKAIPSISRYVIGLVMHKDPYTIFILCSTRFRKFEHVMLDLRSAINIMPASIYFEFQSYILQFAYIIVQLANLSFLKPLGLVRDILVRVNDFPFHGDFYVVHENASSSH